MSADLRVDGSAALHPRGKGQPAYARSSPSGWLPWSHREAIFRSAVAGPWGRRSDTTRPC